MMRNNAKRIASGAFAFILGMTLTQPLFAEELNTEIPSAGATVAIEDYVENVGNENDLSAFLPKEETAPKTEANTQTKTEAKQETKNELFSDIAIARVAGGEEGYVNVRRKPNANSKRVGKIYNNCGARIIEKTSNGWYKIVSGKCTGYIKSEYFVTGQKAQTSALDDGYVFANVKDTGVHVRKTTSTDAEVVTNVYHNESYVVKKVSNDGKWVKVKIKAGVSGWVSSDYVKMSVDMDTAITNAEEKAAIKAQKQQEEQERQAELEAQQREQEQQQEQQNNDTNNTDTNSNTNSNTNTRTNTSTRTNTNTSSSSSKSYSKPEKTQSYGDSSSSGGASAVVAYAKKFLGNPYVYGGSSLTNGTDCSGFTMSVYAHFGYSLNRSSYTQVYNGRSVSMSSLKPGDLLFYKYGGSTISHVAMYIGGGQIIHASTEKTGIIIGGMGSPCAARRIIG